MQFTKRLNGEYILAQSNTKKTTSTAKTTAKTGSSANKRGGSGKSSGGKKSSGKKSSGKKNSQVNLSEVIRKREIGATVLFSVGLLLLVVSLGAGKSGTLWNNMHLFYFAVFGFTGFFIPPAILFRGVTDVLGLSKRRHLIKIIEIFFLIATVCGFVHIKNVSAVSPELDFAESVKSVYDGITSGADSCTASGGVVGAVIGGGIFAVCGSVAISNVICALLFVAFAMFLFGISLFKVFSRMREPARKVSEKTGETIDAVKADIERKKRDAANIRAARRANTGVDPAKIVEDFYSENFTDITNPELKRREKEREKARRAEKKRAAEEGQPSIFDTLLNPANSGDAKDDSLAAEAGVDGKRGTAAPDSDIFTAAVKNAEERDAARLKALTPNKTDFEEENPYDGADAKTFAANEKKEISPLTDRESEKINSELDGALAAPVKTEYHYPPLDCLKLPEPARKGYEANELRANGEKLIAALQSFNVSASIVEVVPGPTVTRYELSPAPGVKISKFTGLSDDLALHMAAPAGLRIEAPIPNKAAIGIEIPNKNKTTVTFREVIDTDKYKNATSKLTVALGKNISGEPVYCDLAKMPHLLVAGTTGSGKSICLHTMIISILYNASPDEVKLLLIDPKQVEFGDYNGIPHLLVPVVSDPRKASGALGWAVTEMLSRYKILNANGVRDIGAYNNLCARRDDLQKMPQIVIVIDELADLMSAAPAEVEDSIQRLAQMARAAGMHLVIATQRPSTDVITGIIKANIPSRIALMVKQQIDSRIIIDEGGAEKLMGHGDMLYYPVGIPKPIRLQGAYIDDNERKSIVAFIKNNGDADYDDSVQQEIDRQAAADDGKKKGSSGSSSDGFDRGDELLMRAVELFVGTPEKASISALQRHLGLGFAKAGRLMDTLEENGIVGPSEGSKPRKVLITKQQWYEMNAMSSEVTGGAVRGNTQNDTVSGAANGDAETQTGTFTDDFSAGE